MLTPAIKSLAEVKLTDALSEVVNITSWVSMDGGCINRSVKLETTAGTFFMKWNHNGPSDLFLREAEGLKALKKASTILRIPEVYTATAIASDLPGILILEFLALSSNTPSAEEKLGKGLAELHRVTQDSHGFYHDNYCGATLQNNRWNDDWVDFFSQQRIWYLVELIENRRGMSVHDKSIYEQLVGRLSKLIGHQPSPALNHGDLWSGNCLYTDAGPALIDPASYFADREFDLALMDMFGGFSKRVWESYQEDYSLSDDWQERVSLYQLYHYLNHYYLFGGSYGSTALSIAKSYL